MLSVELGPEWVAVVVLWVRREKNAPKGRMVSELLLSSRAVLTHT